VQVAGGGVHLRGAVGADRFDMRWLVMCVVVVRVRVRVVMAMAMPGVVLRVVVGVVVHLAVLMAVLMNMRSTGGGLGARGAGRTSANDTHGELLGQKSGG
jgi:hypothetical protein